MKVIDENLSLSFTLELLVGPRGKEDVIPIETICASGSYLSQCLYSIQELKPIKLRYTAKEEKNITFTWNKTYRVFSNEDEERTFQLIGKETVVVIYEHGKTDVTYPWRFGIYHFEVQVGNKKYYGGIQIEPKNVDWEQFQWMLQFMNDYVEGISLDPKFRKNTPSIEQHFQTLHVLHKIDQYLKFEKQLLSVIKKTKEQRDWTVTKDYTFENVPKTRDGKSIQQEYRKGKKYANRRMNRKEGLPYLKDLNRISRDLYVLQVEVGKALDKVKNRCDDIHRRIKKINAYHHSVKNNVAITDRDKIKYRQLIQVYNIELERLYAEQKQLEEIWKGVRRFFTSLTNEIKYEKEAKNEQFKTKWERKLSDTIREILAPRKKKLEVELKPTYLLYEYFVFFATIDSLREIGFQVDSYTVQEQLEATILNEDLLDGSIVRLRRENEIIHVVFNELIDGNYDKSVWKSGKLFSGEESRKPDVRIDYYKEDGDKKIFYWSILLEVKYSPLYNVYQQLGNTKAMEQMYKYWTIKYVYEEDGRKRFNRIPIKEVICIYPGGHPYRLIEDGCGLFLQLYPSKDEKEKIIGQQELIKLIQTYL